MIKAIMLVLAIGVTSALADVRTDVRADVCEGRGWRIQVDPMVTKDPTIDTVIRIYGVTGLWKTLSAQRHEMRVGPYYSIIRQNPARLLIEAVYSSNYRIQYDGSIDRRLIFYIQTDSQYAGTIEIPCQPTGATDKVSNKSAQEVRCGHRRPMTGDRTCCSYKSGVATHCWVD